MKNNILKFSSCANCGACYNICPTKAISIKKDNLFYEIAVDENKCVECGKCISVCPVNNPGSVNKPISAIGGSNIDEQIVKKSSSGGAFSVFANYVIEHNGVVFGAVFDEKYRTVVIKNTKEVPLDKILKSKYVESLTGDSFRKAKLYLDNNIMVLFCGCPCQIAGLKRYLKKDYENLFTCDFSCGGLVSHRIYNDYLDYLQKKYKSNVSYVDFRPKTIGWYTHSIKVNFKNGQIYNSLAQLDPYFYCFIYKHYSIRDYCLDCKFSANHYSDIILADFWLYKKLSKLKCGNGLSLVLSNSAQGEKLLNAVKDKMVYEVLDINSAVYNIRKTATENEFKIQRNAFLKEYKENGFKVLENAVPQGREKFIIKLKCNIKTLMDKIS